jgi:hypothetical protein
VRYIRLPSKERNEGKNMCEGEYVEESVREWMSKRVDG